MRSVLRESKEDAMNRRGFLKLSFAGTAIAVLPAIAPPAQALEAAEPVVEREEMFGVLRLVTTGGPIEFGIPRRCWEFDADRIFCKFDSVTWEAADACTVTAVEIHCPPFITKPVVMTIWTQPVSLRPHDTLTVECGGQRGS